MRMYAPGSGAVVDWEMSWIVAGGAAVTVLKRMPMMAMLEKCMVNCKEEGMRVLVFDQRISIGTVSRIEALD